MIDWPARAGDGEPQVLTPTVEPSSTDRLPLAPRKHYLAVDALSWYVNRDPSFWNERMVSGTIEVAVGDQIFKVALGTYDLERDTHLGPSFNKAILEPIAYRGGKIRIHSVVKGIEQDNALGGILRSVATASINVVSGAISTASIAGPALVLKDAGTALIGGVQTLLAEGKKPFAVFDQLSGLSHELSPESVIGPDTYLLLHRGNQLSELNLRVRDLGQDVFEVRYDGVPLEDGAWILLRVRRTETFGRERPWEGEARRTRDRIDDVMFRWSEGDLDAAAAMAALATSESTPPTIGDMVASICTLIAADAVLVERETLAFATAMRGLLSIARKAVGGGTYDDYKRARKKFVTALEQGGAPTDSNVMDIAAEELTRIQSIQTALSGAAMEQREAPSVTETSDLDLAPNRLLAS
ncbi:MAG: hypothetical protein H0V73_11010 [Chloroflexi bacterium]|nr:hypothetical protein [Chloroflexota bacterium]